MSLWRETCVLLAVAAVPAAFALALHPSLANRQRAGLEPGEVRLTEVRDWGTPVLWVDARPAAEALHDRIPGAMVFDGAAFDRDLGQLLGAWTPGQRIVVYCGSSSCDTSREVAERLREAGLDNVHHLHGGWDAWVRARQ